VYLIFNSPQPQNLGLFLLGHGAGRSSSMSLISFQIWCALKIVWDLKEDIAFECVGVVHWSVRFTKKICHYLTLIFLLLLLLLLLLLFFSSSSSSAPFLPAFSYPISLSPQGGAYLVTQDVSRGPPPRIALPFQLCKRLTSCCYSSGSGN
jgi:hypothetical protein